AVAAAALGTTALFILSCHLDPRDLQAITETVRQQRGVPVVLACDRWDADVVGPAVLAGAQPVLNLPYTSEDVISAIDKLPARARPPQTSVRVGDLVVNLAAHDVSVADVHVDLSRSEFDALLLLVHSADSTVARSTFASSLWPSRVPPDTAITSVTRRLRRKLTEAGLPAALHTVRGVGYRLDSAGCARKAPIRAVTRASTSSTMLATS
ncbi:MAG: winged helix-turn-helix domain-containing protein, partial [Propionicimonas sp.]|nr:winged helix-turn-helix domain-containing protein [Propionicimonas sp.]